MTNENPEIAGGPEVPATHYADHTLLWKEANEIMRRVLLSGLIAHPDDYRLLSESLNDLMERTEDLRRTAVREFVNSGGGQMAAAVLGKRLSGIRREIVSSCYAPYWLRHCRAVRVDVCPGDNGEALYFSDLINAFWNGKEQRWEGESIVALRLPPTMGLMEEWLRREYGDEPTSPRPAWHPYGLAKNDRAGS